MPVTLIPIDEQHFLVKVINFLQEQKEWDSTAVVILYDDSDGWYDHQMGPIVNTSTGPADALTGPDACGTAANSLPGIDAGNTHALGRCGYGPRQPLPGHLAVGETEFRRSHCD